MRSRWRAAWRQARPKIGGGRNSQIGGRQETTRGGQELPNRGETGTPKSGGDRKCMHAKREKCMQAVGQTSMYTDEHKRESELSSCSAGGRREGRESSRGKESASEAARIDGRVNDTSDLRYGQDDARWTRASCGQQATGTGGLAWAVCGQAREAGLEPAKRRRRSQQCKNGVQEATGP